MVDENNRLLKSELDALRQTFNTTQTQLQKFQDILINNEIKYKNELKTHVSINGDEMKQMIKAETDKLQQLHSLELKQHIEK